MSELGQNLRFATRRLVASPAFTLVSVVTITRGLGANATLFGFVNAIVFRPLDVVAPDRLVRVDAGGADLLPLLLESDYEAYRDRDRPVLFRRPLARALCAAPVESLRE